MTVVVRGMGGLGDCIHQRAIIRRLMDRRPIWLHTPWPSVYHDMKIHLLNKGTPLRTQTKNAKREAAKYCKESPPLSAESISVHYSPQAVRERGSVLDAMAFEAGVTGDLDFRLPIPDAWKAKAQVWLDLWKPLKPLLIYRPLNERSEWSGCPNRNPDWGAYASLIRSIARKFFVVSIADFEDNREWFVGERIQADVELHKGELDFETIAALTQQAALVYSSPGFLIVLAQAVETPQVCVFGGYENGNSFTGGARFAPYLPIEPIHAHQCFSHTHACDKRINLPLATERLATFVAERVAA